MLWRSNRILRRVFVDGDDDDRESFQVSRRMSRHAVRAAVAVAALSLAVLGSPVQAQDTPSAAQEVADLRDRAKAGDATAQYNLGLRYDDGLGVPLDDAEAVIWYRLAAAQGHATAQYNLGVMYGAGRGVPQDDAEAVIWYRLAAAQGHATAQYNLGLRYDDGLGVPLDDAEAVIWYRLAAAQGHATAQNNLGVMYGSGEGVPQDDAEAVIWYPPGRRAGPRHRPVQPRSHVRRRSGRAAR